MARQGDPYLLQAQLAFDDKPCLDAFVALLQRMVDRHDILRTSVAWEDLAAPVQIVWRQARVVCDPVQLNPDDGDVLEQLQARFDPCQYRLALTHAPLLQLHYAQDPHNGRLVALLLFHHIVLDHSALAAIREEMQHLSAVGDAGLPTPTPYRTYVTQALRARPRRSTKPSSGNAWETSIRQRWLSTQKIRPAICNRCSSPTYCSIPCSPVGLAGRREICI